MARSIPQFCRNHKLLCQLVLVLIAFFLRTYQLPNHPSIWGDEASAGYEALSLLQTGHDRWGVALPVYFTEWGSGQNVLHSYLSIPVIAALGLNPLSARLTTLFAAMLTIVLLYAAVKNVLGERPAWVAMTALAISPWHIMSSRWGHDSNEFPFFLLLGCYLSLRALSDSSAAQKIIAFVPWGMSVYSYAIGYVVVPTWVGLITLFNWRRMLKHWKAWLVAFGILGIIAFPIVLFLIKNFVAHQPLPIESYLPFGMPLLPFNRAAQVSSEVTQRWLGIFFAILSGFQEGDSRNALIDMAPMLVAAIPLAIVGVGYWLRDFRRTHTAHLFLLWLGACMPMLLSFDFGVLRFSALYVPLLVAAADGWVRLADALNKSRRKILITGIAALAFFQAGVFLVDYFLIVPSQLDYQFKLSYDFGNAIRRGVALATPAEDILVTNALDMPEMLMAFYLSYPPERYQVEERHHPVGDIMYETVQVGRFHFGANNYFRAEQPFVYVLLQNEKNPCAQPRTIWQTSLWKVGQCGNAPGD